MAPGADRPETKSFPSSASTRDDLDLGTRRRRRGLSGRRRRGVRRGALACCCGVGGGLRRGGVRLGRLRLGLGFGGLGLRHLLRRHRVRQHDRGLVRRRQRHEGPRLGVVDHDRHDLLGPLAGAVGGDGLQRDLMRARRQGRRNDGEQARGIRGGAGMDLVAPQKLDGGPGRRTPGDHALAVGLHPHEVEGRNDGSILGRRCRSLARGARLGGSLLARIRLARRRLRLSGVLCRLRRSRVLRRFSPAGPRPVKHSQENRDNGCSGGADDAQEFL